MTVSLVAPPTIRSPGRPVTFQFWENGFQLERRGREPERPPRRVVVGRDLKGAWSARRPPPFILTAVLLSAERAAAAGPVGGVGRNGRSVLYCSALCVCMSARICRVHVWLRVNRRKSKSKQASASQQGTHARRQGHRGSPRALG